MTSFAFKNSRKQKLEYVQAKACLGLVFYVFKCFEMVRLSTERGRNYAYVEANNRNTHTDIATEVWRKFPHTGDYGATKHGFPYIFVNKALAHPHVQIKKKVTLRPPSNYSRFWLVDVSWKEIQIAMEKRTYVLVCFG